MLESYTFVVTDLILCNNTKYNWVLFFVFVFVGFFLGGGGGKGDTNLWLGLQNVTLSALIKNEKKSTTSGEQYGQHFINLKCY